MTLSILEQERNKAREMSKAAIEAGEFLKFFRRHPTVMDNMANEAMLRAAVGESETPIMLEELEIVFQNDDLKDQLSWLSPREVKQKEAAAIAEEQKRLRGSTVEELRAQGQAKQKARLDQLSRPPQIPAYITRMAFITMGRAEREVLVKKFGYKALNEAFDQRD